MMKKYKKYKKANCNIAIAVKLFCKKHLSTVCIAHLLFNTIFLNYLVIYIFLLQFFQSNKKNILNNAGNISNLEFSETWKERIHVEKYEQVTHLVGITYIIFCLAYYILELFTKWNKKYEIKRFLVRRNKANRRGEIERENNINSSDKNVIISEERKKEKRTKEEVHITINHILLCILLAILGLSKYNKNEKIFYFYFVLIICEINRPLIIFMNIIKGMKKYYKNTYLKKESSIIIRNAIKKKDLVLFFCYFVILRFFKLFTFCSKKFMLCNKYDSSNKRLYKGVEKKNVAEEMGTQSSQVKDNTIIRNLFSFYYNLISSNILTNYGKNALCYLIKYTHKLYFVIVLIKKHVNRWMSSLNFVFTSKLGTLTYEMNETMDNFKGKGMKHCMKNGVNFSEGDNGNANELNEFMCKQRRDKACKGFDIEKGVHQEKDIRKEDTISFREQTSVASPGSDVTTELTSGEGNHIRKINKREYAHIRRNVNKYKNYYEEFKKNKEYHCEDKVVNSDYDISRKEIFGCKTKEKRSFHVIEDAHNKYLFDHLDYSEYDLYNIKKCTFNVKEEDSNSIGQEQWCKENAKLSPATMLTKNINEKSGYTASSSINHLVDTSTEVAENVCKGRDKCTGEMPSDGKKGELYYYVEERDKIEFAQKEEKKNEINNSSLVEKDLYKGQDKETIKDVNIIEEEYVNMNHIDEHIEKGKAKRDDVYMEHYNTQRSNSQKKKSFYLRHLSILRNVKDAHEYRSNLKKFVQKNFFTTTKTNDHSQVENKRYSVDYCKGQKKKFLNNKKKKKTCLEKTVKLFLDSFKRRKQVLIFLNTIHKILLMINILLIFFVKGIIIYIILFSFMSKYDHSSFFFRKFVLILIQCCYFFFFHFYVRQYKQMMK
ncbi:conserved Plasmodium protein, unknown function [Plasmodium malariae]|uniref:Uncharacterized protein n=1 Tax=Plasmodium malariae TaxID=5858 RepID=A0A1D3JIX4_PLAMA|nr:conserved Plasmodium protein, unknown function [Plasmodium malariae]SBT86323.1 conserved Plasmodium protein, unknown function [Plasmodium malariae]